MSVRTAERRILVVEDDESLRRVLGVLLGREGFDVVEAASGREALALIDADEPALVILDLGLPDMSGIDVLCDLRLRTQVPVIVLSGREAEADRVLALEMGADDYVVKPFLNREMVARVRVRLRRPPSASESAEPALCGLAIDARTREVRVGGEPVALTAREFDLLAFLAASPRQVFSREQVLEAVWNSSGDWQTDATVTEHIRRLRQKVGPDFIATVRGVGYRFEPDGQPS